MCIRDSPPPPLSAHPAEEKMAQHGEIWQVNGGTLHKLLLVHTPPPDLIMVRYKMEDQPRGPQFQVQLRQVQLSLTVELWLSI